MAGSGLSEDVLETFYWLRKKIAVTFKRFSDRSLGEKPDHCLLTIASPEIVRSKFSNVSLTCWIDYDYSCPEYLSWHLNNNPEPLPEDSLKFKVEEKDTHSKCKTEFVLFIFNVTESDEGTYSCHWHCEYENTTKAAIDLKVFNPQPTGRTLSVVKSNNISRIFSMLYLNVCIMVKSIIPRTNKGYPSVTNST